MIEIKHKQTGELIAALDLPTLARANLSGMDLAGADMREMSLFGTDLSGANLEGADFRMARIPYTIFRGANLRGAVFAHAKIHQAILTDSDLTDADLRYSNLFASLSNSQVKGIRLSAAVVSYANLRGACLNGTLWRFTRFFMSEFNNANLMECRLQDVTFDQCDLSGARLGSGKLGSLTFRRVNLTGTDFTGAALKMRGCSFIDCPTLHLATGLDTIRHQPPRGRFWPSFSLDVATLRGSVAHLPASFLAACGLSTDEVEVLRRAFAGSSTG